MSRLSGKRCAALLFACLVIVACRQQEPTTIVVTEVVVVEGEDQIVTRLIQKTVPVTVTPDPRSRTINDEPITLDASIVGGMPDIDPQRSDAPAGIDLIENLFVGLTSFNNETNRIEPELATTWQVGEDGRTWTFRLRDDIFWVRPADNGALEDGSWDVEPVRQVVAQDIVYAIQRGCQRATGSPDAFVLYIIVGCKQVHGLAAVSAEELETVGARALDDFTLEISLEQPASYLLSITSMPVFHPLPPEVVEENEGAWQEAELLISSGPFVLAPGTFSRGRPVLYRNPIWPIPRRGNVDIVNIVTLDDEMHAYQLWEAKRLDISPLPAAERDAFLDRSPTRAKLITEQTVFFLSFNFASGVLREAQVRRALSAAIDRDRLVEELRDGRGLSIRHLSPPGVIAAPPVNEVGKGYDPDYARQQMAESGFRSCRLMPPVTFMVSTTDLSLQQAELIRQMWIDELGCTEDQFVITQVQFGALLANTRPDAGGQRPDIWELGWATYYPDAQNWLGDLLHCTDSENRQIRPCSDIDELIRQARRETDNDGRVSLYRQIEDRFFGAEGIQPIVPLYAPGEYLLVQSWLNFTPALFGGEQYDTYVIDPTLKRLERSR